MIIIVVLAINFSLILIKFILLYSILIIKVNSDLFIHFKNIIISIIVIILIIINVLYINFLKFRIFIKIKLMSFNFLPYS